MTFSCVQDLAEVELKRRYVCSKMFNAAKAALGLGFRVLGLNFGELWLRDFWP